MVVKNGTKSKKTAKAKQPVKASKEQVRKGVSQELKSLVDSLNKKFLLVFLMTQRTPLSAYILAPFLSM